MHMVGSCCLRSEVIDDSFVFSSKQWLLPLSSDKSLHFAVVIQVYYKSVFSL